MGLIGALIDHNSQSEYVFDGVALDSTWIRRYIDYAVEQTPVIVRKLKISANDDIFDSNVVAFPVFAQAAPLAMAA